VKFTRLLVIPAFALWLLFSGYRFKRVERAGIQFYCFTQSIYEKYVPPSILARRYSIFRPSNVGWVEERDPTYELIVNSKQSIFLGFINSIML